MKVTAKKMAATARAMELVVPMAVPARANLHRQRDGSQPSPRFAQSCYSVALPQHDLLITCQRLDLQPDPRNRTQLRGHLKPKPVSSDSLPQLPRQMFKRRRTLKPKMRLLRSAKRQRLPGPASTCRKSDQSHANPMKATEAQPEAPSSSLAHRDGRHSVLFSDCFPLNGVRDVARWLGLAIWSRWSSRPLPFFRHQTCPQKRRLCSLLQQPRGPPKVALVRLVAQALGRPLFLLGFSAGARVPDTPHRKSALLRILGKHPHGP
jgi:hypothetical protein